MYDGHIRSELGNTHIAQAANLTILIQSLQSPLSFLFCRIYRWAIAKKQLSTTMPMVEKCQPLRCAELRMKWVCFSFDNQRVIYLNHPLNEIAFNRTAGRKTVSKRRPRPNAQTMREIYIFMHGEDSVSCCHLYYLRVELSVWFISQAQLTWTWAESAQFFSFLTNCQREQNEFIYWPGVHDAQYAYSCRSNGGTKYSSQFSVWFGNPKFDAIISWQIV